MENGRDLTHVEDFLDDALLGHTLLSTHLTLADLSIQ